MRCSRHAVAVANAKLRRSSGRRCGLLSRRVLRCVNASTEWRRETLAATVSPADRLRGNLNASAKIRRFAAFDAHATARRRQRLAASSKARARLKRTAARKRTARKGRYARQTHKSSRCKRALNSEAARNVAAHEKAANGAPDSDEPSRLRLAYVRSRTQAVHDRTCLRLRLLLLLLLQQRAQFLHVFFDAFCDYRIRLRLRLICRLRELLHVRERLVQTLLD